MIAGALHFLALLGAVEEVEPVRASRLGAELAGHPELAEEVVRICQGTAINLEDVAEAPEGHGVGLVNVSPAAVIGGAIAFEVLPAGE